MDNLQRPISSGNLLPNIRNKKRKINTLKELFIVQLQCMYYNEILVCQWFPRFIEDSYDKELLKRLKEHDEVIQAHVQKLQNVFSYLEIQSGERKSDFLPILLAQYEKKVLNVETPLKDLFVIQAMELVEHYKQAGYRALIDFAWSLNQQRIANILQRTFEEECSAYVNLNSNLLQVLKNYRAVANTYT